MTDEDLDRALTMARRGDTDALAQLWACLQPGLLRYLRLVDRDNAEDVASETWVAVLRDLPRFRGDVRAFRSWLFTVARNRGTDAARARRRRPAESLPQIDTLVAVPAADTEAYDSLLLDRALHLVGQLPGDQAEVVALRIIAGLDVATVSRLVGKKPGHVRVLCHRGLARLAQTLTPERFVV